MEISDKVFKEFRTFLKVNGLYKDFMECFREQKYWNSTCCLPKESFVFLPNYIKLIRKNYKSLQKYERHGAMALTFVSFNWVNGGCVPLDFTRKWCTVNAKWGLYCISNDIGIGREDEFKRLITYWNGKNWIDPYLLSQDEKTILKYRFNTEEINGIYID
jgi:hypothetical protein